MAYEITSGKISKAQKVVIYGPEGVGKSNFAAAFPDPLFIDTEGSTGNIDVKRLPRPTSWNMLLDEINFVISQKPCKSMVIDTIDWAEQLCIEHILAAYDKKGIEDFGYGNGYVYEKEEFGRLLNRLEDVIAVGINVVLTAHAQLRKFSQPDEIGEYDRWELKLGKKTGSQISPLIKEWSDMLLFANYKTYAVAVDKDAKKFKAQGGKERIIHTEHHACWDAKNRHGLAPELPLSFSSIAHIFAADSTPTVTVEKKYWYCPQDNSTRVSALAPDDNYIEVTKADYDAIVEAKNNITTETVEKPAPKETAPQEPVATANVTTVISNKALSDLMQANGVTEAEIRKVVALKGYYPEATPIDNYDRSFVDGVLVGAWDKVFSMIAQQRELSNLPI